MTIEELKEQARRHEQREEWRKAFDLYSAALRVQAGDETPDITLFNRVGDIQTRLGQINGAVEKYEKAINLYLEAELPNNAIAICKKVLRNLPDRNVFFLRMGQIRAGQGFLTDARQHFLTYAERQTAAGDVESALNALIEFVDLSPEDVEIRESLASQLESHGRPEEAVDQYTEVYRRLVLMEREEEAAEVSEKIRELAPELDLPDPDVIKVSDPPSGPQELVLESTSLADLELEDWSRESVREVVEAREAEAAEKEKAEAAEKVEAAEKAEAAEAESGYPDPGGGIESGSLAEVVGPSGVAMGDEMEGGDAAEEEEAPLSDLGFEAELESEEEVDLLSGFDLGDAEIGRVEGGDDSLPLIVFEDDEGDLVETQVEATFEDVASETLHEGRIEPEAGTPVLVDEVQDSDAFDTSLDYQGAAESGDLAAAISRVRTLIDANPEKVELHQRYVEYAFRKNDQDTLVLAYLSLAGCLARTGAPGKARAVYRQVLSLSPGNADAAAGIGALEGGPADGTPSEVASSEEYVDLGSMVLGEGHRETTRWTVAAEDPSGDDEADFEKMLDQFKAKVSEHVAVDDVVAHHDLGTAYLEMGLVDEAIAEFQMALRASPGHLPTHEVMGRCWLEKGQPDMAVRALGRALQCDFEIEDELIGIYFLMGTAHEAQGNTHEALEFYEKVFSLDINFEDVTERLRALR